METLASEQVPSPRLEDYVFQAKDFANNDQHGRVALKQLSTQNLQNGVGVVFYSPNDAEGKQRYEGQIKNTFPGNFNTKTNQICLVMFQDCERGNNQPVTRFKDQ